jgi:hypothetical protein
MKVKPFPKMLIPDWINSQIPSQFHRDMNQCSWDRKPTWIVTITTRPSLPLFLNCYSITEPLYSLDVKPYQNMYLYKLRILLKLHSWFIFPIKLCTIHIGHICIGHYSWIKTPVFVKFSLTVCTGTLTCSCIYDDSFNTEIGCVLFT